MKLSVFAVLLLSFAGQLVTAQYFSQGWQPGQPIPSVEPSPVFGKPREPPSSGSTEEPASKERTRPKRFSEVFSLNNFFNSEPVVALFNKFGINITERVEAVNALPWDVRIPLLTDDNYGEMIANEIFSTAEEEERRVWAILVSAGAAKESGISKFVDQMYDENFNLALEAGDLPDVRWARIDYMNVTYLTTKWSVWQAPNLVILTDRGQTLRFYRPQYIRLRDGGLYEFLKKEIWKMSAPWKTSFAPGGSREYILEHYANIMTKIYSVTSRIPRWIMFVLSGSVASFAIGLMHKGDNTRARKAKPSTAQSPGQGTNTSTATGSAVPTATTEAAGNASGSNVKSGKAAKKRSGKK